MNPPKSSTLCMFRLLSWTTLSAVIFLLLGCNSCPELDEPIGASVTCKDVLKGEYQACYGWGWDEGTTNWCESGDYYLIQLGKSLPGGGHSVEKELRIPPSEAITTDWFFFERPIVEENITEQEVCFRATEPSTCFEILPEPENKQLDQSVLEWTPPNVPTTLADGLMSIFAVVPGRSVPGLIYDFEDSPVNFYELPLKHRLWSKYFQHLRVSVMAPRTIQSISAVRAYEDAQLCMKDARKLYMSIQHLFPREENEYGSQWLSEDSESRLTLSCNTGGGRTPYYSLRFSVVHIPTAEESWRRLSNEHRN